MHLRTFFVDILMKRLNWHIHQEQWLSNKQFSFQAGRSCDDALVNIISVIENGFKQNKYIAVVYLDIAGAFDGAWHPAILKSLMDRKCHLSYIQIINSFLSKRNVKLSLGETTVDKTLTVSCPQGDTMSPILWNVDIDDVKRLDLGENCHSQAFADDSDLCVLSDNLTDLENDTNTALQKMFNCAKSKKMLFSPEKCKVVVFSKKINSGQINVKLQGNSLELLDCE